MVERRKRVRHQAARKWTEEDREVMRTVMTETLGEFHKGREAFFDGLTPAQHVNHHLEIEERNRRWKAFVEEGLKESAKIALRIVGIALLATLAGSKMYDWISRALGH